MRGRAARLMAPAGSCSLMVLRGRWGYNQIVMQGAPPLGKQGWHSLLRREPGEYLPRSDALAGERRRKEGP